MNEVYPWSRCAMTRWARERGLSSLLLQPNHCPPVSPTCHPWGQEAGISLWKQTSTTERGKCGGPQETFHKASTALGPVSPGVLGHDVLVSSYNKQEYMNTAEINASFSWTTINSRFVFSKSSSCCLAGYDVWAHQATHASQAQTAPACRGAYFKFDSTTFWI